MIKSSLWISCTKNTSRRCPAAASIWPQPDHFRVVMLPEAKDLARAMTDVGEFLQTYRQ